MASLENIEMQIGHMANTLAQINRQPESFPSNTEPNPRQNDRAQCPSVTLRIEVQPEPESENVDELVSSSSSPNPSSSKPTPPSSKPTPPSPFKQCIPPPFKQTSFNEEKAYELFFILFFFFSLATPVFVVVIIPSKVTPQRKEDGGM
ncbi:hypothetical protein ACLOJK_014889 [Asimina triloba]